MGEAIFSGELERMTTELMRRLAVRCAENKVDSEALAAEERSFLDRNKIESAQLPNWLERLGRDLEWFNEMVAMEAEYRRRCETVLVTQAPQRELVVLRLPLTPVETEVIGLQSQHDAQEASIWVV